jgi:hypothetical protein
MMLFGHSFDRSAIPAREGATSTAAQTSASKPAVELKASLIVWSACKCQTLSMKPENPFAPMNCRGKTRPGFAKTVSPSGELGVFALRGARVFAWCVEARNVYLSG